MTAGRHRGPTGEPRVAYRSGRRRAETWLWTGPVGHLVGGTLDLVQAIVVYWLARAREARRR